MWLVGCAFGKHWMPSFGDALLIMCCSSFCSLHKVQTCCLAGRAVGRPKPEASLRALGSEVLLEVDPLLREGPLKATTSLADDPSTMDSSLSVLQLFDPPKESSDMMGGHEVPPTGGAHLGKSGSDHVNIIHKLSKVRGVCPWWGHVATRSNHANDQLRSLP